MKLDAELSAAMGRALVKLNAEGDNANVPGPREKIRASMTGIECELSWRRYLDGDEEAPVEPTDAANFMAGQAMETLILRCMEMALQEQEPDFAWDLFPQPDGTMGWQPDRRYDCGFAVGRPDAIASRFDLFADAKTASASQFAMKSKEGGKSFVPQQAIYAEGLARHYGRAFRCVVGMYNKENKKGAGPPFEVFVFEPNAAVLDRLAAVAERAKGPNPKCSFGPKDWQVRYCPYRNLHGCGGA